MPSCKFLIKLQRRRVRQQTNRASLADLMAGKGGSSSTVNGCKGLGASVQSSVCFLPKADIENLLGAPSASQAYCLPRSVSFRRDSIRYQRLKCLTVEKFLYRYLTIRNPVALRGGASLLHWVYLEGE